MIAARQVAFGRGGGKKLPYDAEVEYLYFTGAQYIDTGLVMDSGHWVCDARVRLNNSNENYFISTMKTGVGGIYGFVYNHLNKIRLAYKSNFVSASSEMPDEFFENFVTFHADYSNGSQTLTVSEYGVNLKGSSTWGELTDPSAYSIVFGGPRKTGNSGNGDYLADVSFNHNDVLVRDFIPVRVGDVGYMYDKVSGQLFGNAGTGAFVLGADI